MRCRAMCASFLVAAVLASEAFGQDAALDSIAACVRRLDPQTDIGYERIAARCPDLTHRLDGSSWAAWLPREWKEPGNDLSVAGLQELRVAVARELSMRTPTRAPDLAPLNGILAGLGPLEPDRTGWWGRMTRWLREAFERRDQSSASGWLDRMIARVGPSQGLIEGISYVCLGIVVVLALGLVANELRLAGVFDSARNRKAGGARQQVPVRPAAQVWAEIQHAPARDRPRLLLELIVARLTELNRLPAAGALTIRELTGAARLDEGEDQAALVDVALAAERVRFSGEPVADASLQRAIERGRRLLERL